MWFLKNYYSKSCSWWYFAPINQESDTRSQSCAFLYDVIRVIRSSHLSPNPLMTRFFSTIHAEDQLPLKFNLFFPRLSRARETESSRKELHALFFTTRRKKSSKSLQFFKDWTLRRFFFWRGFHQKRRRLSVALNFLLNRSLSKNLLTRIHTILEH